MITAVIGTSINISSICATLWTPSPVRPLKHTVHTNVFSFMFNTPRHRNTQKPVLQCAVRAPGAERRAQHWHIWSEGENTFTVEKYTMRTHYYTQPHIGSNRWQISLYRHTLASHWSSSTSSSSSKTGNLSSDQFVRFPYMEVFCKWAAVQHLVWASKSHGVWLCWGNAIKTGVFAKRVCVCLWSMFCFYLRHGKT